jgi:hypothetical protein
MIIEVIRQPFLVLPIATISNMFDRLRRTLQPPSHRTFCEHLNIPCVRVLARVASGDALQDLWPVVRL